MVGTQGASRQGSAEVFKKVKNRKHDEYTRILADDIHGVWSVYSKERLHAIELDVEDMNLHSEREWRNLVTNRTHRKEEKRWREGLQAKAKLRTYRTIKSKLRMEPNLRFSGAVPDHQTPERHKLPKSGNR